MWQHHVDTSKNDLINLKPVLDERSQAGWELVAASPVGHGTDQVQLFWKRNNPENSNLQATPSVDLQAPPVTPPEL